MICPRCDFKREQGMSWFCKDHQPDPLKMNWLEEWGLRQIIRKQVIQGVGHDGRIANLYRVIREAVEEEFIEDSAITIDVFLKELFEMSQKCIPCK